MFCTRCVSEYDYSGWDKWGAYYRRRCSTKEGTEEANATGDRCDYKRDIPEDEDQEDDDEEISSLDAFELVVPPTPIGHTQLDSEDESSESEDKDQERYVLTPPRALSIAYSSHEDNEEDDDDEEDDFQWTLSPPRPYSPTTAQVDVIPFLYIHGEECERLNTNENNWDTVPLSPTEPTHITGYSSVEEARNALYNNSEGEAMRDWSGCFGSISAKGSETAMCGDEDDWEQPLWSPVLLTLDGFF